MKNIIKKTLLVFTLFYSIVSFAQTEWKSVDTDTYEIKYPSDWSLAKKGYMSTDFFVFSQAESTSDLFRENVNLIVRDFNGLGVTLDKFVQVSERQVVTLISDAKMISSKRLKKDDLPFQKVVYTGSQGKYKLKFVQYYFIIKQQAYILTFTSEVAQFDNYYPIAEKILNSFRIKS